MLFLQRLANKFLTHIFATDAICYWLSVHEYQENQLARSACDRNTRRCFPNSIFGTKFKSQERHQQRTTTKLELARAQNASSLRMMREFNPANFRPFGVYPQQMLDVTHWCKAERSGRLEERRALGVVGLGVASEALVRQIRTVIDDRISGPPIGTVSVYWSFKSEPHLRSLLRSLGGQRLRATLPLVETNQAPLTFLGWTPNTR